MSETPRTNALARWEPTAQKINGRFVFMGQSSEVVSAEECRFIETELAGLRAELAESQRKVAQLRLIANVNGDWNLKYGAAVDRAEAAERQVADLQVISRNERARAEAAEGQVAILAPELEAMRKLKNIYEVAFHESQTVAEAAERQVAVLQEAKRPWTPEHTKSVIDGQVKELDRQTEVIKAERASREAAERDAARYRWLREQSENHESGPWPVEWIDPNDDNSQTIPCVYERLDAAIDTAARREGK